MHRIQLDVYELCGAPVGLLGSDDFQNENNLICSYEMIFGKNHCYKNTYGGGAAHVPY